MSDERKLDGNVDLTALTLRALESAEFKSSFSSRDSEDRRDILERVKRVLLQLNTADLATRRAERLEFKSYDPPEDSIRRLLRSGRYLDFSNSTADTAGTDDRSIRKDFLDLLDIYSDHISDYENDSIAHLCLSKRHFNLLREGKIYTKDSEGNYQSRPINTISEFRDLLVNNSDFYFSYQILYRRQVIYRRCDRRTVFTLGRKLVEWDAIPDDQPPVSL